MIKKSPPHLILLIGLIILSMASGGAMAQGERSFEDQTKAIRVKKIVNEWQGSSLTFQTRDGEQIRGQLIEVSRGNYHLQVGLIPIQLALDDVIKITYEPGTPELLLNVGAAVMGSAFLTGALIIAKEDASNSDVSTAGLLGLLAGWFWGHSIFYESEVIYIE